MAQDHLGLFDTPPSRNQVRSSVAIVGLLFAVLILILTVRDIPLGQIDAFIPMIDASTTLVDLIIATLLYVQASVFRSRALGALACLARGIGRCLPALREGGAPYGKEPSQSKQRATKSERHHLFELSQ